MAAWILGFVTLMPLWLWQVLHVAVLPLLRSWWLVVACLITFPLWFDIQTGNLMIFIAVTGFWAYRGNGPATALFLVLTLLVPRPLMIPLAAWILWNRPQWRLPFLVLFVAHAAIVIASGYAAEWLDALFRVGPELTSDFNYGPSRFIGLWWVPIGLALAAWLTWRGRLGLASLADQPVLAAVLLPDAAPGVRGDRTGVDPTVVEGTAATRRDKSAPQRADRDAFELRRQRRHQGKRVRRLPGPRRTQRDASAVRPRSVSSAPPTIRGLASWRSVQRPGTPYSGRGDEPTSSRHRLASRPHLPRR